ncbi:MAG TPA: malate dehydrogenase [Gammaproteobacteria bacterium]|nr:malate dehydrogenase [Gammaproteobacteria bacterium]
MNEELKQKALNYHAEPRPGKLGVAITKECNSQHDLGLAYTPGVAVPVGEIQREADLAYRYTNKGNLVAVISDGTAVLGLGNTGALASKPVMEGKGVLFKKFADVDVFDIEVDADTQEKFIETVTAIAPTFGGINLEDIAAPHCFEIERILNETLDIPVFHDDQHGTAIIVAAGLLNALEIQQKKIGDIQIVCLGAGAAGLASMDLLIALGAKRENMRLVDRKGVIFVGREGINKYKGRFAVETKDRTLADAMRDADVFIGVSGPNLVTGEMLKSMAPDPVVFALSNPIPEIMPSVAHSAREDLIMATGRSDFPNQVNNVLGFPFIFRGALDVWARTINREMHVAAVKGLTALAREPVPQEVLNAYRLEHLEFGPNYITPLPFDPRLREYVASAVARAAVDSGVARKPYPAHYPQEIKAMNL